MHNRLLFLYLQLRIPLLFYSLRGSLNIGIRAHFCTSRDGHPKSTLTFPRIKYKPLPFKGYDFRDCGKCTVSKKWPSASKKVPNFILLTFLERTFFSAIKSPTIRTIFPS